MSKKDKDAVVVPKFDVNGQIVKRMDQAWILSSRELTVPVKVTFAGWERTDK